jgi:hypothetical protein
MMIFKGNKNLGQQYKTLHHKHKKGTNGIFGCKWDNMNHTHSFGIVFYIILFLDYSTKKFRKDIFKS